VRPTKIFYRNQNKSAIISLLRVSALFWLPGRFMSKKWSSFRKKKWFFLAIFSRLLFFLTFSLLRIYFDCSHLAQFFAFKKEKEAKMPLFCFWMHQNRCIQKRNERSNWIFTFSLTFSGKKCQCAPKCAKSGVIFFFGPYTHTHRYGTQIKKNRKKNWENILGHHDKEFEIFLRFEIRVPFLIADLFWMQVKWHQ